MKPWYPPTYTWKAETSGTTSFFYATPADTSIRYSTLPKRPEYTTHPHSPQPPPPALTHSPQIPGREIHPNWDSRWCLTVRTRIFVDGTPVEMYAPFSSLSVSLAGLPFDKISGRCTGSLGENWEFKRSPGRTRIRAAGTNFCLEGEIGVSISQCHDIKAAVMTMCCRLDGED
jgi:hypothetical protein